MNENYSVIIKPFAERHYIKQFAKKYYKAWDVTIKGLTAQFERVDRLSQTNIAEIITSQGNIKIIKTDFKVAGSKDSAKTSGYRTIIAVHEDIKIVNVLLVYAKTNIEGEKETEWWKKVIKSEYKEYKDLL